MQRIYKITAEYPIIDENRCEKKVRTSKKFEQLCSPRNGRST